jgi:hypothetical protein
MRGVLRESGYPEADLLEIEGAFLNDLCTALFAPSSSNCSAGNQQTNPKELGANQIVLECAAERAALMQWDFRKS